MNDGITIDEWGTKDIHFENNVRRGVDGVKFLENMLALISGNSEQQRDCDGLKEIIGPSFGNIDY
jgi:hypothetical protein